MILLRNSRLGSFLRTFILLGLSVLILNYTPNARYGMSKGDAISIPPEISLGEIEKNVDSFVSLSGHAEIGLGFTYKRYGITYYWIPLQTYEGRVLVRALSIEQLRGPAPGSRPESYSGKLAKLDRVAFSKDIKAAYLSKNDVNLPEETYALLLDEEPSTYGFVVFLYFGLIFCWLLLALYIGISLIRSLKGR